jgi:hypothetical protein
VSNFPFEEPVTRRRLDRHDLEDLLRAFEDAWARETGERVTSAEFYDRYSTDDTIDSMFTMAWSSYYEIFRRLSDSSHAGLIDSLVTAR